MGAFDADRLQMTRDSVPMTTHEKKNDTCHVSIYFATGLLLSNWAKLVGNSTNEPAGFYFHLLRSIGVSLRMITLTCINFSVLECM